MKVTKKGKQYIFKNKDYEFYCKKCGCRFCLNAEEMNDRYKARKINISLYFNQKVKCLCPCCYEPVKTKVKNSDLILMDIDPRGYSSSIIVEN